MFAYTTQKYLARACCSVHEKPNILDSQHVAHGREWDFHGIERGRTNFERKETKVETRQTCGEA